MMTTENCSECGGNVSRTASSCDHCGHPRQLSPPLPPQQKAIAPPSAPVAAGATSRMWKMTAIGLVILVVGGLGFVAGVLLERNVLSAEEEVPAEEALSACGAARNIEMIVNSTIVYEYDVFALESMTSDELYQFLSDGADAFVKAASNLEALRIRLLSAEDGDPPEIGGLIDWIQFLTYHFQDYANDHSQSITLGEIVGETRSEGTRTAFDRVDMDLLEVIVNECGMWDELRILGLPG